ncbi:MAG: diphthine--ammonia ligase [Candidatus Methanomethyliaceae archaeon]|nr:diphthine--ammonia ligase [Candidatus Methanomethyliaceae archaeon]MDW7970940.1 diphthine--ammonia ligase [Nitrososphaerota archaeon]
MRIAILYSGGKDSNLALYYLIKENYEIAFLLTVIPNKFDSWMFHRPNVELAKVQAECLNLPWQYVNVSGEKDFELYELKTFLSSIRGIDGIATGVIASKYQKEKIEDLCKNLNLKPIFPLWGKSELLLLKEIVSLNFEVYFTSVSAEGIGKEWLGRRLDMESINLLMRIRERYGINISGEGGEYETFVCNSPLFKMRIKILEAETIWKRNYGYWIIKKYILLPKI